MLSSRETTFQDLTALSMHHVSFLEILRNHILKCEEGFRLLQLFQLCNKEVFSTFRFVLLLFV